MYACDEGGVAICSVITGGPNPDWVCDLTLNGDTTAASITVVYSTSRCASPNEYCAWGTDASGVDFCCALDIDADAIDQVVVMGGAYDDNISLTNTTEDLQNWASSSFLGLVFARAGNDTITGSPVANAYYVDKLYGEDDSDQIDGQAGNDLLFGGEGVDIVTGGDGDDEIDLGGGSSNEGYGDDGADTIRAVGGSDWIVGGAGPDTVYAGNGDDQISGGDGNDILYGEGGADLICGDYDSAGDTLIGGPGDDELWGATALDTKSGGLQVGSDLCDANGTNTGCEGTLTARPGYCP